LASILDSNQLAHLRINAKRSAGFDEAAFGELTGHVEIACHLPFIGDGP
jgi:hypothetical protein